MKRRHDDPTRLAELLGWPKRLVRELRASGTLSGVLTQPMRDTLGEHLAAGVDVNTAYSGLGMPEMASHLIGCEVRRMWKGPVFNGFRYREAWENKARAQSVLVR